MSEPNDKEAPREEEDTPEPPNVLDLLPKIEGATLVCPRCSNEEWWLMDRHEGKLRPEQVGSHFLKVRTIACDRCGLIERYVDDILTGKVKPP